MREEYYNKVIPAYIIEKAKVFKCLPDELQRYLRTVLPSGKSLEFYVGWLAFSSAMTEVHLIEGAPSLMMTPFALYNARCFYILSNLPYAEIEEFCRRFQEYIRVDGDSSDQISIINIDYPPNEKEGDEFKIITASGEELDGNDLIRIMKETGILRDTDSLGDTEVNWDATFKSEFNEEVKDRLQKALDLTDTGEETPTPERE